MAELNFKSDLNKPLFHACRIPVALYLRAFYNLYFEGLENFKALDGQGFVMLPKHQSYADIFLEGTSLYDSTGRYAHYVMKDSLPKFYDKLGGSIRVTRRKDIKTIDDKVARRAALEKAMNQADYFRKAIPYLMERNEIVIIHPEIERNFRKQGQITSDLMTTLTSSGETNFVAVDFEYECNNDPLSMSIIKHPFSKLARNNYGASITVKVHPPFRTNNEKALEDYLKCCIPLLRENIE